MKPLLIFLFIFVLGQMQAQDQFIVYFDFDIDEATTTSNKSLSQWIADNPDIKIEKIYGYTDSIGTINYNNKLSQRRAASIYNQLKNAAIFVTDAEVKGFGEITTDLDAAKNRKAVVMFSSQQKPLVTISQKILEPQLEPMPVLKTLDEQINYAKKGDKIILQNINFYYDSPRLLPESTPMLDKLVYLLVVKGNLKIDIQGHKCCALADVTNLSGDRAESVYQYLIKHGINKDRLSYQGFGTKMPIYKIPEKTEAQREANRRVEIEILEN